MRGSRESGVKRLYAPKAVMASMTVLVLVATATLPTALARPEPDCNACFMKNRDSSSAAPATVLTQGLQVGEKKGAKTEWNPVLPMRSKRTAGSGWTAGAGMLEAQNHLRDALLAARPDAEVDGVPGIGGQWWADGADVPYDTEMEKADQMEAVAHAPKWSPWSPSGDKWGDLRLNVRPGGTWGGIKSPSTSQGFGR